MGVLVYIQIHDFCMNNQRTKSSLEIVLDVMQMYARSHLQYSAWCFVFQ